MRILVVEDDANTRHALKIVLEAFGHNALLTKNTEEAAQSLAIFQPEVILLDLLLEGTLATPFIQVARDLLSSHPPKIVIVSAMHNAGNVAERHHVGFVAKPFSLETLETAIRLDDPIPDGPMRDFDAAPHRNEKPPTR